MRNKTLYLANMITDKEPRHTKKGTMKLRVHHRESKITQIEEIDMFDIVITTYHTVSAEWKQGLGERKSILFSKHWNRLILDEGSIAKLHFDQI